MLEIDLKRESIESSRNNGGETGEICVTANTFRLPSGLKAHEKINFIFPALRLNCVKDALRYGNQQAAKAIGVNCSTIRRWVAAYKIMGEEAHIFKVVQKRYKGAENRGGTHGVSKFSLQDKMDIIDRCGDSNGVNVAFQLGMCPDTIGRWRKQLNYYGGWKKKNREKQRLCRRIQFENRTKEIPGYDIEIVL